MSSRSGNDDLDIWVLHADGSNPLNLTRSPTVDAAPEWSPDGRQIAFQRVTEGSSGDIYVMGEDGSGLRALTAGPERDSNPAWSPDGSLIAFERVTEASAGGDIYLVNADGSGLRSVTTGPDADGNPDWSPDGARLVFERVTEASAGDIFVVNVDGSALAPLVQGPGDDTDPAWSVRNRIAFTRTGPGGGDIFVVEASGGTGQGTAVTSGVENDGAPAWSPDGDRIAFYRARPSEPGEVWIMAADGSKASNLTFNSAIDSLPTWGPPESA